MLDNKKYDLWSDGYGAAIHLLDDQDEYPVAGYGRLLNEVYCMVRESEAKKVLDAGFGTGILTRKLYEDGFEVYGMDISEQMVNAGKESMPDAHLVVCDYSMGMPLQFLREEFDIIISTYAFHHMDCSDKSRLIAEMLRHLRDGGKIIIGDLAFSTKDEMKAFRKLNKENWLYEDMYIVFSNLSKDFPEAVWTQISKCAGIVTITK